MFPELDLYYTDPAQRLRPAGSDLDYLDGDLFVVWSYRRGRRYGYLSPSVPSACRGRRYD